MVSSQLAGELEAASKQAQSRPLLGVFGPTASGKSELAMALCEVHGGELVTVDSAQIFEGLDIGTATPSAEEQARIPHHLINCSPPDASWSAARFQAEADRVIHDIWARGKLPILCGGTGLWLRALLHGVFEAPRIDPELRSRLREDLARLGPEALHRRLSEVDPVAASRIAPQDPQRIGRALEVFEQTGRPISELQAEHGFKAQRYRFFGVAKAWPREELRDRIGSRSRIMFASGMIAETEAVLKAGYAPDCPGLSVIGYRDVVRYLEGALSLDAALEQTITQTRRYAKRQKNWFNHEPEVHWIAPETSPEAVWEGLRARVKDAGLAWPA